MSRIVHRSLRRVRAGCGSPLAVSELLRDEVPGRLLPRHALAPVSVRSPPWLLDSFARGQFCAVGPSPEARLVSPFANECEYCHPRSHNDFFYELAKILGRSNIKMTERYAKLARKHIAKTGSTAREIWKLMEQKKCDKANVG